MAQTAPDSSPAPGGASGHQAETTFKKYSSTDAEKYAAYRPTYNPKLIELVLDFHTSTGGQTGRVLDVGCGPGLATRQLASHFQHVFGSDASPAMIAKAQEQPIPSATGAPAEFQVCDSEYIDQVYEPESIDLVTIATAAHWFDMPKFYAAAAKVLKPGGSIAIWCGGSWFVDPDTTPNAQAVQDKWSELELEMLQAFELPGNRMVRELYKDLPLPWSVGPTTLSSEIASALASFDKQKSTRREFNADGRPDPAPMLAETKGFMKHAKVTLEQAAAIIGTASPVTRWREAHKEQLEKGEIEDCVARMIRLTREELAKVEGEEPRGWVEVGVAFVLIVLKKKD